MLFHFISFCVLKFIGKIWKQIDFYLKIQDMWKVLFDAIQWKYNEVMYISGIHVNIFYLTQYMEST